MKRILLTFSLLFFASLMPQELRAEIVSASTAKVAIDASEASGTIQGNLVAQGMSPVAAMEVVQQMSVEEISYFGQEAERNQAGGSVEGAVVFVLVVVVLVFLIVYLVDRT